jgi:hypothetical protein
MTVQTTLGSLVMTERYYTTTETDNKQIYASEP